MKNSSILFALSASVLISITAYAEEDKKEILFRDINWGISYSEVKNILYEYDWYTMYHDSMMTRSVDEILLGDYKGIDFPNAGFNMIAMPFTDREVDVAGYITSGLDLYLAFPVIDGEMVQDEENAIFYGARYEFEPEDTEKMYGDLKNKLSSLYGEPIKDRSETDWIDIVTYTTVWEGANDTYVSLVADDVPNEEELWPDSLFISYAWGKGDDYLKSASDAISKKALEEEASAYGNENVDGL